MQGSLIVTKKVYWDNEEKLIFSVRSCLILPTALWTKVRTRERLGELKQPTADTQLLNGLMPELSLLTSAL